MKKLSIIFSLVILFAACKKESGQNAAPKADFTFSHNTTAELRLGTTDTTMLISSVSNTSIINWDLGDGRKSTEKNLVLSYPKSGTYTVKLIAQSNNGKTVTVSKKVTVLDRVLKTIVIDKVYWNTTDAQFAQAGWPLTNAADIYVKIQQLQGDAIFNNDGFVLNAPVVYESPVVKNVSSSTTDPITINVTPKVILDKSLVQRRYVFSLIAKNTTGEYVLFSNWYSGSGQMVTEDSITKNMFIIHTSFFSSMTLFLDFE
jgi:PKD repeat protein